MLEARLRRNVGVIYALNGCWMFMILIPVIIPFFESRGLDFHQIYLLQAIFSAGLLLLEIPSGYISDLFGRKTALFAGGFFWALGYSIFPVADSFALFAVAEVLLALGVSLFSGTDVSLLYDSLLAMDKSPEPIKFVGQRVFYKQLGETLAGLVGGWCVLVSIDAPAWAQMGVSWLPFLLVFLLFEPPREKMSNKDHRENAKYMWRSLFQHSKLLNLVLLNTVIYGVSTLIAVWSFQKYWQNLEIPLLFFGYLWAATNLTVAIVGRYAHTIDRKLGSTAVLVVIGVLPIIGYFGMALADALWGVLFCFCFQITRALNAVILSDAINRRVSSDMRATANSVTGIGVRVLFIGLGPLAGFLTDTYTLSTMFFFFGILFLLAFFIAVVPLLGQRKHFEPIVDQLEQC